jgi:hypothetical protein
MKVTCGPMKKLKFDGTKLKQNRRICMQVRIFPRRENIPSFIFIKVKRTSIIDQGKNLIGAQIIGASKQVTTLPYLFLLRKRILENQVK